jgi:hypothetical protein
MPRKRNYLLLANRLEKFKDFGLKGMLRKEKEKRGVLDSHLRAK